MGYLDDFRSTVEEREQLTERTDALRNARGVPDDVPLVVREGDTEGEALLADWDDFIEREQAFYSSYLQAEPTDA